MLGIKPAKADEIIEKSKWGLLDSEYRYGFNYGVKNIPHSGHVSDGGDDAWIARPDFLAIADGTRDEFND